jgi:hypothetical protein
MSDLSELVPEQPKDGDVFEYVRWQDSGWIPYLTEVRLTYVAVKPWQSSPTESSAIRDEVGGWMLETRSTHLYPDNWTGTSNDGVWEKGGGTSTASLRHYMKSDSLYREKTFEDAAKALQTHLLKKHATLAKSAQESLDYSVRVTKMLEERS